MNFNYLPYNNLNSHIPVSNFLPLLNEGQTVRRILDELTSVPRKISSMFFYDDFGSKLFKQITQLPDYYLTRLELLLIQNFANRSQHLFNNLDIIELGSGDCIKISIILNAVNPEMLSTIKYIPVDISLDALIESASMVHQNFPNIQIHCYAADFLSQFHHLPYNRNSLYCFFGSTIGNLTHTQRYRFLKNIAQILKPGDMFLLGIDMVKKKEFLERAYNDTRNITAQFNRNILNVVNSLTGTNFNPFDFEHCAVYNSALNRIEMCLKAHKKMIISSPNLPSAITLEPGEVIYTENSYKFSMPQINAEISSVGLTIQHVYTDENNWFSLLQIIRRGE